jgi:tetratricopeptide (TPR) repeat protein
MPIKLIAAALIFAFTGSSQAQTPPGKGGSVPKPLVKPQTDNGDTLGRTVFQALLGDIALQRGNVSIAVSAWSDLAQRTRDPKVLARATEVAAIARQYDLALELNKWWLEVEPASLRAQQVHSALLASANRLDELAPQLAAALAGDPANLPANLLHLNRLLARHEDKKAVLNLVETLATPYDNIPEAHFATGQAAAVAGDPLRARTEFDKALALRPDWEIAALARAQNQARQSNESAIAGLKDFVDRYPQAGDARLALARLLLAEKNTAEARKHFDRLIEDYPNNPEVIYPVAMLALQNGDLAKGRGQLEKLLQTTFPDKSALHYFLGQIEEEDKKIPAALEHYRQVTPGEHYIPARSRSAKILLTQGRNDEARQLIDTTRTANDQERRQLILAESQLLREFGRHDEAYALLKKVLLAAPDDIDLLYEAALTAERRGDTNGLERHLKHLLKRKPDHAHALNALGYSLAERNTRLDEAQNYLTQALALAPEDPFIMDSMGWLLFRQGKLQQALSALEAAYKIRPDPEIAAHLGEVLWALQRHDEARAILQNAAASNPDNEVLAGTIKKLLP